jgi:hypothetical protein
MSLTGHEDRRSLRGPGRQPETVKRIHVDVSVARRTRIRHPRVITDVFRTRRSVAHASWDGMKVLALVGGVVETHGVSDLVLRD